MPEWLSILPPFLAIAVAVWKKEVILALGIGIWLAEVFLILGDSTATPPESMLMWVLVLFKAVAMGLIGVLERCVSVFGDGGNARVLLFGLVVGALLELMQRSGGVAAFVNKLASRGLTESPRQVSFLASIIGVIIFVETSMSVLAAGVVSRKLFDKFKMSRARLAFLVDSTCAPISVLVLLNGWGAYILSLLTPYNLDNPAMVLAGSVPFNFYALLVLCLVFYTSLTLKVHGPMKEAERLAQKRESEAETEKAGKARYMIAPMLVMILGIVFFMFYTGYLESGRMDIRQGSGSRSVLWSVSLATFLAVILLARDRVYPYKTMVSISYEGMGKLLPVVTIMLLSFAIGSACKQLGTGPFVAGFVGEFLPGFLIAPLLFICAGVMSFTTGTSWGTFAILIPVGIPLAQSMGLPTPMVLSAILGGGVFGDHCSPISDTTIISSLAAGCDHLEHVRTQLPYAMAAGLMAILLYTVSGLIL